MNDEKQTETFGLGPTEQAAPSRACPAACGSPVADLERLAEMARETSRLAAGLLSGSPGRCRGDGPARCAPPPGDHHTVASLARYAQCPFQGWAVEVGLVRDGGAAADAGAEAHRVIAEGIRRYAEHGADPSEYMSAAILDARPDVQHEASAGLSRATGSIGRFLTSLGPEALLAFRGGPGAKSGRLTRRLPGATPADGGVVLASDFDLLHAGGSQAEVCEIDFKSGRRTWTATRVRQSLRFRAHAWLVFGRWPRAAAHHVRVWNTRGNSLTPAVTFNRRDALSAGRVLHGAMRRRLEAIEALGTGADGCVGRRIARAHEDRPGDFWWPGLAKCAACPAPLQCPAADSAAGDLAADPERYVRDTAAMTAALDLRLKALRAHVREGGADLVFGDTAFGVARPAVPRSPTPGFYRPVSAVE